MDEKARITDLRSRMVQHGWDVWDLERDPNGTFWRVGAENPQQELGAQHVAGGSSAVEAMEELCMQTVGQLPWFVVGDQPDDVTANADAGGLTWRWSLSRRWSEIAEPEIVDVIIATGAAGAADTRIVQAVETKGRTLIDELADHPELPASFTVSRDGIEPF
jgi:hypothetical protein